MLLLKFLRELKAVIKAKLELPACLDSFLLLLIRFSLFLDNGGGISNHLFRVLITIVECEDGGFLQKTELFAVSFVQVHTICFIFQFFIDSLLGLDELLVFRRFSINSSLCTFTLLFKSISARSDRSII